MTVEDLDHLKSRLVSAWTTIEKPKPVMNVAPSVNDDEFAKTEWLWQHLELGKYNVYSPELRVSMPLVFLPVDFAFYHWPSFGTETISYIESAGFGHGSLPAFDIALHGFRALLDNEHRYFAHARSIRFSRGETLLTECRELFAEFTLLFD